MVFVPAGGIDATSILEVDVTFHSCFSFLLGRSDKECKCG